MKIIAVIPAYNEEKTIGKVIKDTKKFVDEIIVVDDGSTDRTGEIARKLGAIVLRNKKNRGVGYAKRRGLKEALKRNGNIIITLDADMQHNPYDIPKFVNKILEGYDFVIGARNLKKYPFIKKFGNFLLNLLINFLCRTKLRDTESGYKAFSAKCLKKMKLKADGYAIEGEIVYEVGKNKLKYCSINVDSPRYRSGVTVIEGIKNFLYVLKRKFFDK